MKWYDISMPITETMQVYKDRDANRPKLTADRSHDRDGICETRLQINLHTGTHLDAPLHMVDGGETIDSFPLSLSWLAATVLDLTGVRGAILPEHLKEDQIVPGQALLLQTQNSHSDRFQKDYVYLSAAAAKTIARIRPALIGIDALGIERSQEGHPTHKTLFAADVWVLEGLRLAKVKAGSGYDLHLLPLLLPGKEASPVRAVLSQQEKDL